MKKFSFIILGLLSLAMVYSGCGSDGTANVSLIDNAQANSETDCAKYKQNISGHEDLAAWRKCLQDNKQSNN